MSNLSLEDKLEHLPSVWSQIAARLQGAKHILLLLDYDGTLTPIVERPELAHLPEDARQVLLALARKPRFTVGVISGRSLADLKKMVGIPSILYAGNHGLEIEGPGLRFVNPLAEGLKPVLKATYLVLNRTLSSIKGAFVEDKGLSLSVHYRQVEESQTKEVKNLLERLVSGVQALGKVRVTSGKKVYEVRPAIAWDKGKAIKLLMKRCGKGGRKSGLLPLYIGDDRTDEDGFRAIQAYGNGISVLVGEPSRESEAGFYLKSPAEVAAFLGRLLEWAPEQ
ncbi:MAG: trehalose-phosphatase [Chloroflexota bacterium]